MKLDRWLKTSEINKLNPIFRSLFIFNYILVTTLIFAGQAQDQIHLREVG